ncbi:MAG: PilZ domain-containing protein [Acidobacteria bacterium]|nr:PilZ domain-containing protein [Acidobacteriota bacterium]
MKERESERVSIAQSVVLDSSSGRREVRVSDLSTGGCYVDCISALQPNEIVKLRFILPHGRSEEIPGTIVYVHPGIGFGVQFNDMTAQQRTVLEQLILLSGGRP